ncbi:hypothetical protein LTR94_036878, partial [Friedmanniomyces endolithicus]
GRGVAGQPVSVGDAQPRDRWCARRPAAVRRHAGPDRGAAGQRTCGFRAQSRLAVRAARERPGQHAQERV